MSKLQDLIATNTSLTADNLQLRQQLLDVQDALAVVWIWLIVKDLKGELILPDQLIRRVDDQLSVIIARQEHRAEFEAVVDIAIMEDER